MMTTRLLKPLALAAAMLLTGSAAHATTPPGSFSTGNKTFLLNGQPFVVKAAEVHYPRIPRPYWEHRIRMCKALGMNTLCIYVFWNIHEQKEGVFDFSGNNDVAEFCRLAQKNGMYVIVRPGPYVCAEWEMGGLPWWLLKKKDIRLRERDPYFMERVKFFEEKVGEQLAPLTIQNGGPIIMVQVENEYGSYGEDKPYISEIRDCLRGIYGNDLALFQCDWSSNFWKNGLDDLTWTMNFGTGADIDQQFKRLGEMRPDAPQMCSEFWSGWFDKWGARHETRPAKDMVEGLEQMLSRGISFSLYMTHGGTSFGHWAGANSPGFAPDVTSYDYDAPINEYGQATPKFWELRTMMQKYNNGQQLPSVPKAPMPIVSVPRFELTEFAPLTMSADNVHTASTPLTFEEMDMGWGMAVYTTAELPEIKTKSVLHGDFHDYAQVFIDQQYIGTIDRVRNEKALMLPPISKGQRMTILVEGMGRINFGRAIKDFKGIVGDVTITAESSSYDAVFKPRKWACMPIDDSYETATAAFSNNAKATFGNRGYYRGYFNISKLGDTFLNFEQWGKGQVWVNGHAMGRIWSIGPQQTLYVPGCWLKKGKNEIIVLDIIGPKEPVVWGQTTHELNKLQTEKPNKHNDQSLRPSLSSTTPVRVSGGSSQSETSQDPSVPAGTITASAGNGWQTFKFASPQKGRHLVIECLSTQKDGDRVAIAELYLQGADGRRLSRESWTVRYATSEDDAGNRTGDKAFDLQESTYWQTEKKAALPHLLVIDMGSEQTVTALEYLPRAEQGAPGCMKDFRIYLIEK